MAVSFPRLSAIVAMAANRVIGSEGTLPWHYPEDLQFFKHTTMGHPIIMGRATYQSIGRPLPGRRNIVISSTLPDAPGIHVIRSINELGTVCRLDEVAFVIGGARLFGALLPHCEDFYLTYIDETPKGDVFLPPFEDEFHLAEVLSRRPPLEFRRYIRTNASPPHTV